MSGELSESFWAERLWFAVTLAGVFPSWSGDLRRAVPAPRPAPDRRDVHHPADRAVQAAAGIAAPGRILKHAPTCVWGTGVTPRPGSPPNRGGLQTVLAPSGFGVFTSSVG